MAWPVTTDEELRESRVWARAFRRTALTTYHMVAEAYECWGGGLIAAEGCDAQAAELERECLRYEVLGPPPDAGRQGASDG